MKPIDFDKAFADYAQAWARERIDQGEEMDAVEAAIPQLYRDWLNRPAPFLNGVAPADYFRACGAPAALIDLMKAYYAAGISIPDPLLECLIAAGEGAVSPLCRVAADQDAPVSLRMTALNLLIELEAQEPMALCVALVDGRAREDELADVAAELLAGLGASAVPAMLERLDGASDEALDTYLDLLCNFPGDQRIYQYTVERFLRLADRRALYATYLARLGDERALDALNRVVNLTDLDYLDYLEVRNAIEALGGQAPEDMRRFDGDPAYESLKNLN